jgi:hypothetical protein
MRPAGECRFPAAHPPDRLQRNGFLIDDISEFEELVALSDRALIVNNGHEAA